MGDRVFARAKLGDIHSQRVWLDYARISISDAAGFPGSATESARQFHENAKKLANPRANSMLERGVAPENKFCGAWGAHRSILGRKSGRSVMEHWEMNG